MNRNWTIPLVVSGTFILLASLFLIACREEPVTTPGTPAPQSPPTDKAKAGESDNDFLGLSQEAGEKLAERRRIAHRVVSVDGESRPVTMDFREDRVNFEIEVGKIGRVKRG